MSEKKERKLLLNMLLDYCIRNNADPMDVIRPLKVVPEEVLADIDEKLNKLFLSEKCNQMLVSIAWPNSGIQDSVSIDKDCQRHVHVIYFKMGIIKRILSRVPDFKYVIKQYLGERNSSEFIGRAVVLQLCCEVAQIMKGVETSICYLSQHPFYGDDDESTCNCGETSCRCKNEAKENAPDIEDLKFKRRSDKSDMFGGINIVEMESIQALMNYIFGK